MTGFPTGNPHPGTRGACDSPLPPQLPSALSNWYGGPAGKTGGGEEREDPDTVPGRSRTLPCPGSLSPHSCWF